MQITCLDDLQYFSAQDILNHVKDHLLYQNKKSKDKFGFCTFLSEEGNRCALGSLMSEEEAIKYSEQELDIEELLSLLDLPQDKQYILERLWYIHDNLQPEEWEAHLILLGM